MLHCFLYEPSYMNTKDEIPWWQGSGSKSVFTWRHVRHIGVPKQWHGGHVGVPNKSCGSWTLFLCKNFLLLFAQSKQNYRGLTSLAFAQLDLGRPRDPPYLHSVYISCVVRVILHNFNITTRYKTTKFKSLNCKYYHGVLKTMLKK